MKDQTKFYRGSEAMILALDAREIENREIASKSKKTDECKCFAKSSSFKKFVKKGKYGERKEVKYMSDRAE